MVMNKAVNLQLIETLTMGNYMLNRLSVINIIAEIYILGPVYCSLDVEAADVIVATALVDVAVLVVDVEDSDNDGIEDCVFLFKVWRLITISVGISMVIDSAVDTDDVLVRVVTGSKQTSNSVVPDEVCKPAISFKSIQLAPTLSLSVKGKLKTRVSFSSTM
ncbi:hypothetical protein FF38_03832 [Lucilia cuprina]|uniref:Uncharacterized protein n=1 Tax=Lucilia cuprina TaxID=7375 RepID=A0A0L0CMX1_LUCCU|nr:hypothetical protein FF38_03832 [Lucilia cuprina]